LASGGDDDEEEALLAASLLGGLPLRAEDVVGVLEREGRAIWGKLGSGTKRDALDFLHTQTLSLRLNINRNYELVNAD